MRRILFGGMVALVVGVVLGQDSADKTVVRRPNILLILTDDHYARALGSINPEVVTPHLDRLAQEGLCSLQNYITFPVCHSSRCTILTGRYPSAHRAWQNGLLMRDSEVTLGEALTAAGYQTAAIGKMHYRSEGQTQGFAHVWNEDDFQPIMRARNIENHVTWDRPKQFMYEVGILRLPAEETINGLITRKAVEWLDEHATRQPWLLIVSYPAPHAPTIPTEKYARMYDPEKIALPPNVKNYFDKSVPWYPGWVADRRFSDEELRLFLARYYALVTQVDDHIGDVLDTLGRKGLLDETIVMFAGDQGDLAGEHGGVGKGAFFYEAEARFPLIVRYPRLIPAGRVTSALVSQVDLMPTLLDLADVPIPIGVQGVSQTPVFLGEQKSVRDACFGEIQRISKYIRTERYALTWYREKGGELYDLVEDAHETRNVFNDPDHAPIVQDLMRRLIDWSIEKEDMSTPVGHAYSPQLIKGRNDYRLQQKVHHPGLSVEPGPETP